MATRALIVWSTGAGLACASVALAATSLAWRAPTSTETAIVAVSPADVQASVVDVAIDLPAIDGPAELAGFEPSGLAPSVDLPGPGVTVASFLDPNAAWVPYLSLRPAFEEARPPAPADIGSTIREVVRDELASLDPGLARLSVRPPPRPAFLEAPTRPDAAPEAGIVEVRSPSSLEGTGSSFWSWATPVDPPRSRPERPLQSGMASWYGPGFHGRKTASGERFDQNALTAAHRSLPFGTKVKVVDQTTGRSIVVRINDRGPFAHGRVIDLSKASAAALGMGGLARVQIVSAE